MNILVVDDNEMHLKLASFLLQEAGYTPKIAGSAERALELLKSFQPQLILVDLELPGMDGLELTRHLRADPAYRSTPIVAVTAYTSASDIEQALQAGCDGHIAKPLDTGNFVNMVREFARAPEASTAKLPAPSVPGQAPDLGNDPGDLRAELRNMFLTEGLRQCEVMSSDLEFRGLGAENILRISHRWAAVAGVLGFPAIAAHAASVEALSRKMDPRDPKIARAIEVAGQHFRSAIHAKRRLPLALITGLKGVCIGLVNFSPEEAQRIRNTADRSSLDMSVETPQPDALDHVADYDALIVNDCTTSVPIEYASRFVVPVVFVASRASLQSLSKMALRSFDFVIAPWDAEEVLLRVFRLIPKSPARSRVSNAARPRVLVADDDPDIVMLVSEVLGQMDIDCEVAGSGNEALEAIRRDPPDGIVLDVNMFDFDGFEVLRRIRRNFITQNLPVLMLTGRGQESDVARGFNDGANDYVVKPFDPLELANRVVRMISSRDISSPQVRGISKSALPRSG